MAFSSPDLGACCFGWLGGLSDRAGQYRLGPTIGRGQFAKVRLAAHVGTGETVAVRVIPNRKLRRERLQQEIEIHRLLDHQNVARLLDVVEIRGYTFMFVELAAMGDLQLYIDDRPLVHMEESRRLFQQIIAGVEHCHTRMVAHRDLKPPNILLDSKRNVKIADFGMSAIFRVGSVLRDSCGSPSYAAPELFHSGCEYEGPEVDVWSCGVLLYVLLCNRLPFRSRELPELAEMIWKGRYSVPESVPPAAKDLIGRMLTVHPAARISVPSVRRHEWLSGGLPALLRSLLAEAVASKQRKA